MTGIHTLGVALQGLRGAIVDVEANVVNATPRLVLIGLPDASLNEARDRVRSALQSADAPLLARHLVVNLSPAALPKHGSGFDLAIAIVAAAAAGVISPDRCAGVVHLGELALDGRLRPVAGVLPAVLSAVRAGVTRIVVPYGNLEEASLVPGIEVHGAVTLRQVLIEYGATLDPIDTEHPLMPRTVTPDPVDDPGDLSDVIGHADAVDALVVAAAGGHHLFLLGPPGAGKTMLARRLPGILPELTHEEAVEVASVASLAGEPPLSGLNRTPPWQAPHHTATATALAGGGSGVIRPGAIARAHRGVLFLDEAPEFPRIVLDVLRQPIETGHISIHRAHSVAHFPARFQLVLAANPCPCGLWGLAESTCQCPAQTRRRYLQRVSGPLLDRVDIQLWIPRIAALPGVCEPGVSSAAARDRVCAARDRARARLHGTGWMQNAEVPGSWLRKNAPQPADGAVVLLGQAVSRGTLSMRGADRVLRVAWTLADVHARAVPNRDDVRRALALRTGALA